MNRHRPDSSHPHRQTWAYLAVLATAVVSAMMSCDAQAQAQAQAQTDAVRGGDALNVALASTDGGLIRVRR